MRKPTLILLLLSALCLLAMPVLAEEELFDTKAAVQHVQKGIENLRAKKYDAAIAEFEESVSIDPDAEAYYLLGYSYYMKGKTGDAESREKAKENFERAYELNPNFSPNKAIAPLAPPAPAPAAPEPQAAPPAEKPETAEGQGSVTRSTAQPAPAEQPAAQTAPEPPKEPQQPEKPAEPQPPAPPQPPKTN